MVLGTQWAIKYLVHKQRNLKSSVEGSIVEHSMKVLIKHFYYHLVEVDMQSYKHSCQNFFHWKAIRTTILKSMTDVHQLNDYGGILNSVWQNSFEAVFNTQVVGASVVSIQNWTHKIK